MTPYDIPERLRLFAKKCREHDADCQQAMDAGANMIDSLREELACTYEELIEHTGDDMIETRHNRVMSLRFPYSS